MLKPDTSVDALEQQRSSVERKTLLLGILCSIAAWSLLGIWAAFVLTVTWGVGIVCFRGLAVQVRGLSDGSSGLRFGLLRLATLALAILFVSRLGITEPEAFVVGLCVLPAALVFEALHQLFTSDV